MPTHHAPDHGVFRVGQNLTLVDIWIGVHSDAQQWQRASLSPDVLSQRAAINDNTARLMATLAECPASRWKALIGAQGITQYGAIALSWCEGADLLTVSDLFFAEITRHDQIDQRAAGRINPAMIPQSRSLKHMAEVANNDTQPLVLMCLGRPDPIIFDMANDWLDALHPSLGAILLQRHNPKVSPLDPQTIERWNTGSMV